MSGMAHDPMCVWLREVCCTNETCDGPRLGDRCMHEWCQCDLIAKVRADEREQAFTRARQFLGKNYRISLVMTAMEFAAHAIRGTPFDELPKYLQREFGK